MVQISGEASEIEIPNGQQDIVQLEEALHCRLWRVHRQALRRLWEARPGTKIDDEDIYIYIECVYIYIEREREYNLYYIYYICRDYIYIYTI